MSQLTNPNRPSTPNSNPTRQIIDRTSTEYVGQITRVYWSNQTDDYLIAGLKGRFKESVKGPCSSRYLKPGITYRFMGKWVEELRFGWTFAFTSLVADTPTDASGVELYLQEFCAGIGPAKAALLVKHFGADKAIETLREDPYAVADAKIITIDQALAASEHLSSMQGREKVTAELFGLLRGKGFGKDSIDQCIQKWGLKAPQMIKKNPFILLTSGIARAGFRRCDRLWIEYGLPKSALKRQLFAGLNRITEEQNGHVWHSVESWNQCVESSIMFETSPEKAMKLGLKSKLIREITDGEGNRWVGAAEHVNDENVIAQHLARLMSGVAEWPVEFQVSVEDGDGLPSKHQIDNLLVSLSAPVGLYCGGPGTGKSFTTSFLLKALLEKHSEAEIAVCAPTGIAAVRITQYMEGRGLNIRATTIHKLLKVTTSGSGGWKFSHNEFQPLPHKFLIVDEVSMKNASLMASFLSACRDGAHVLFVGDTGQLPPVGVGCPMRDMIRSGVVPAAELSEVRRNSGLIAKTCEDIKRGRSFELPSKLDLENKDFPVNLILCETSSNQDSLEEILHLFEQRITRYDRIWECQVVCARNKHGAVSRVGLNKELQALLNPTGKTGNKNFRVGDKIICLKNQTLKPVIKRMGPTDDPKSYVEAANAGGNVVTSGQAGGQAGTMSDSMSNPGIVVIGGNEPIYLANGEIGRVVASGEKQIIGKFGNFLFRIGTNFYDENPADEAKDEEQEEAENDQESDSNLRKSKKGMDDNKASGGSGGGGASAAGFDLAYAITTHKSQGSQFRCVVFVVDDGAGFIASRELVRTGISRATELCIVVGKDSELRKQVRKTAVDIRKTFLAEKIRGELPI